MKNVAGFEELVNESLENALEELATIEADKKPSKPVPKPEGKRETHTSATESRHDAASNDIDCEAIRAQVSGIIDHQSTLLAVAGAAVYADCDPCLDAVAPELESVGMSKADIRDAVESGRFPRAFPKWGVGEINRCDN